jgi:hypothetical protein
LCIYNPADSLDERYVVARERSPGVVAAVEGGVVSFNHGASTPTFAFNFAHGSC